MKHVSLVLTSDFAYHLACIFAGMHAAQIKDATTEEISAIEDNIYTLKRLFSQKQKQDFMKFEAAIKKVPIDELLSAEAALIKEQVKTVKRLFH